MPDGSPIDQWWKSHRPPRAVPQSQAVHLFDATKGRSVCGRRVPASRIAFPPHGKVTCSDCVAAAIADSRQSDSNVQEPEHTNRSL